MRDGLPSLADTLYQGVLLRPVADKQSAEVHNPGTMPQSDECYVRECLNKPKRAVHASLFLYVLLPLAFALPQQAARNKLFSGALTT